jgi:hypothetical protein
MEAAQWLVAGLGSASLALIAWSELGRAMYRRFGPAAHWIVTAVIAGLLAAPLIAAPSLDGAGLPIALASTVAIVTFTSQRFVAYRWYTRWAISVAAGLAPLVVAMFL